MSICNLRPVIKDCNADVDACHVALERVTQLLVAQGLVAYMPCATTSTAAPHTFFDPTYFCAEKFMQHMYEYAESV